MPGVLKEILPFENHKASFLISFVDDPNIFKDDIMFILLLENMTSSGSRSNHIEIFRFMFILLFEE